ncbi:hypothetical protein LLE49_24695 [Alicyclobacillus tolerans]|uniref:hypothetical protein n=1 Tax=Alicyclobacillus tolerans TaxID=90970 RepID=UPI001F3C9906|nr:hypothetical protein [Alicyclobacillus tolerans]MCF8567926.1 hypothetical protein [Alicyclobacillus tolerans]
MNLKINLAWIALSGSLVSSIAMGTAYAATTQYSATRIYLNGANVTNPVHTAAVDPSSHQETTFMPIYYAMEVLKQLGITSTWDGHTWSLAVPSSMNPNISSPSNSPNQMVIAINGTVVQTAPKVVAVDPASNQQTTFIPIFYLSQVLDRLGVNSTWDGTNWKLTASGNATQPVTKLQAAIAVAKTLGIQPNTSGTDPYSDVPQSDWGYVHVLTEDYSTQDTVGFTKNVGSLIAADSSSSFGAKDPATVEMLDQAYISFMGVAPSLQKLMPGGTELGYANTLGLNSGVAINGSLNDVTLQTLLSNFTQNKRGYVAEGNGTYRLLYQPSDNQVPSQSMPMNLYYSDETQAIEEVNATKVTVSGNQLIIKAPTSNASTAGYDTTSGNYAIIEAYYPKTEFSYNGGANWTPVQSSLGFSTLDPKNGGLAHPPAYVLLKSNGPGQLMVYEWLYNGRSFGFAGATIRPESGNTISVQYN